MNFPLSFLNSFRPSTLQRRIRFENAFIPSVRMLKWTRRMRISIYRPAKLARNWSHMVPSVRHFGYSRSSGLAPSRVYLMTSPCFLRPQYKTAFSKSIVFTSLRSGERFFGDRFRRCSVEDSRIRRKTAPSIFLKRISVDGAWDWHE